MFRKLNRGLAWAHAMFVILLIVLLWVVSERWMLGIMATYSPRALFLIPGVLLLPACLLWDRAAAALHFISIFVIAVFVMEWNLPLARKRDGGDKVRVACANIQKYKPDFTVLWNEVSSSEPDVIVFQEVIGKEPAQLIDYAKQHNVISTKEFWVGSRFPLKKLSRCQTTAFNRESAIAVEVIHPKGAFVLINLHTWTIRHGLEAFVFDKDSSVENLRGYQRKRESEVREVHEYIKKQSAAGQPVIVAGDFNMPVSSVFYRKNFSEFSNAFIAAGLGYGYTAPCESTGFYPPGRPWIRIDHILVNDSWKVAGCWVGNNKGSNHRPIFGDLILVDK